MNKRIALVTCLCVVFVFAVAAVAIPDASAQRGAPATPACGPNLPAEIGNVAPDSRCFELRTYTVNEDSSIDLLHRRFRERTNPLFEKHGMTIVGFWQRVSEPNTLTYMLSYPDGPARDAMWAAFGSDPEWIETRNEMQVGLQVESVFMSATDYSPIK
jgi:hypothetical protein